MALRSQSGGQDANAAASPAPPPDAHAAQDATGGPVPENALILRIEEGYSSDSYFAEPTKLTALQYRNGLWFFQDKLVVPDCGDLRRDVIAEAHDTPYSGHLGINKTVSLLARGFWWPTLRQDVTAYVQTCVPCQRNKSSTQKPAGLLQPLPIPDRPWAVVSLDFVTCLPPTRTGWDAILVFVDKLTKMVHFAPTTSQCDAPDAARLFYECVFRLHGVPCALISDRDTRFTSRFWTELCRLLGTKLRMSTAAHPQTDGQTERVNRVLEEMMRAFVGPAQDDWDSKLAAIEFAVNNSVHDSTRNTPFKLNCGQDPLTPLTVALPCEVPAAQTFVARISESLADAKRCLQAAQQRQKKNADLKRRELTFAVGEDVLLSTKHIRWKLPDGVTQKFLPRYIGPYRVVKRVGEVAYELELLPHMKMHDVFHVSLLHKYRTDGRYQPPGPVMTIDGDEEWDVERVLKHREVKRGRGHQRWYLIKWRGHDHASNEWVRAKDAENCAELVQEYWDSVRARDEVVPAAVGGSADAPPDTAAPPLKRKRDRPRKSSAVVHALAN